MDGHEQDRQSEDGHAAGKPHLLSLCLLSLTALLALSVLLASYSALGSTNLLSNAGFENGTSNWQPSFDITFTTSTQHVHSGEFAASLNKSGPIGEIYIFQDVDVVAGAAITLTGWVYKNELMFDRACLRIAWPGSQSPDVESCLEANDDLYRAITVTSATAPTDTARIMAVANISTRDPQEPVYFDDLSVTSNIPPTPTPMAFYVPLVVKSYPSAP